MKITGDINWNNWNRIFELPRFVVDVPNSTQRVNKRKKLDKFSAQKSFPIWSSRWGVILEWN